MDTYFQEFERYGGANNFYFAEETFFSNSELAIGLLKLYEYNFTKLKLTDLFIISCYKLIEDLDINSEDKLYYLENFNIGKKYNKEFEFIYIKAPYFTDKLEFRKKILNEINSNNKNTLLFFV